MKTKAQKAEEMKKGAALFAKSEVLVFADFSQVATEHLRGLRRTLRGLGGDLLVIKKRLLNLVLKEKGVAYDARQFGGQVATIFSSQGIDKVGGPVYKFFAGLEVPEGSPKDMWVKKILGAYDLKAKAPLDGKQVVAIGQLPPREVLLAQLFGMIAAPVKSFLYVLDQKAKRSSEKA